MKAGFLILGVALLAGCAHFQSKPIVPDQTAARLQSRSLTNVALKVYLEENLRRELVDWPHLSWDFDMLTLAAFYYHPGLEVARAQWHVAQAGIKTAGARPNPTLTVIPGYSMNPAAMVSPWFPAINLDVPIETAGKRGKRLQQAGHLSAAARFSLADAAWQVRSGLRTVLAEAAAAQQRTLWLGQQVMLQEEIVKVFTQQAESGAIASSGLASLRVTLQKGRLDLATAKTDLNTARSRVAEAIGIPLNAVDEAELSFDPLKGAWSPTNLVSVEVRDMALRSRADILKALMEYAASEDVLRLEFARQYPDVHFNPGYQFDQGEHKWSLGISVELPMFNRNQGPIAEARARREEMAANFNALQLKVLAEIERATAAYRINENNSATLDDLAADAEKQRASVQAQFDSGAVERLELLNARLEEVTSRLVWLDGRLKLQQAVGALEDAVQWPLTGSMFSAEKSPVERENPK